DLRWMREARNVSDEMIRLFHDPEGGGFFHGGTDAEQLVIRGKELFDNAIPSGNSVAAEILQRLALLTGESRYEQAGVSALRAVRDDLMRAPTMFGHALSALELYLADAREVAIIGSLEAAETRMLLAAVWGSYRPNVVLAAGDPADAQATDVVPLLAGKTILNGHPAAYVCERFVCKQPVSDPAALAAQLA
ncbi:MAG: thioredoxin domain-containing protein, partial [Actinomycetota bacterium]